MTRVAVIILNFNGVYYLKKFLPAVIQNSKPHSVFVADNGSTDSSVDFLREMLPANKLLLFKENLGFCGGYNKAIAAIEADYVILLNSDVEVTPGWLSPLIHCLSSDDTVSGCQPKIKSFHQPDYFEFAGAAGGFLDLMGYPLCRGRLFDTLERDTGQYDDLKEVFWATGACLAIKRSDYLTYGGLDPHFFAHMEEIDLCWRIKSAGKKLFYVPNSTVFHVGGGTLSASNPRKTFYNFRNGMALLLKNQPILSLFWMLPFRWILDVVASLVFLLYGKPHHAWAVFKAHFSFCTILMRGNYKANRNRLSIRRLTPVREILPFAYFINKKRFFSQLRINNTK